MKPEEIFALSFYKEVAVMGKNDHIFLVQHIETGQFFVKKQLQVYDPAVYRLLMKHSFAHIPKVYFCAEEDGVLTVIEEYIPGNTLHSILQEGMVFSERDAIALICQLCDIIQPLHAFTPPLIHRDIKPSNILLTSDHQVKLIDFNAAKQFDGAKNQDTILIGTAGYAAPEQYGFRQSDARTDLYAVGLLLNQLLTGKLIREQLYTGSLPALTQIIKTCTDLNPDHRYPSASALKEALLAVLEEETDQKRGGNNALGNGAFSVQHNPGNRFDKNTAFHAHPPKGQNQRRFSDYLPPGFRSQKPVPVILSALGYFLLTVLCFSIVFDLPMPAAQLTLNRFFCWLTFLLQIFYWGNYREMRNHFPLVRHANLAVRIAAMLLWSAILLFAPATAAVLIEAAFWQYCH